MGQAEEKALDLLETEPIVETFSNPATVKIVTILTGAAGTALTVADIVEQADISKQAFYDNKDNLIRYNLIEQADKAGNATRYKVDLSSEQIQGFMMLRDALITSRHYSSDAVDQAMDDISE